MNAVVQDHRERQEELLGAQTNILAAADSENRELTLEEGKEVDALSAEFERLDRECERRERIVAQREHLTSPRGRQTETDEVASEAPPVYAFVRNET